VRRDSSEGMLDILPARVAGNCWCILAQELRFPRRASAP